MSSATESRFSGRSVPLRIALDALDDIMEKHSRGFVNAGDRWYIERARQGIFDAIDADDALRRDTPANMDEFV